MKKIVAIDIHDVVLTYTSECIRLYGWPSHPLGRTLHEMWPGADWDHHFSEPHHQQFLGTLRPFAGALSALTALFNSKEWSPIFVTATPPGISETITRQLLFSDHSLPPIPAYFLDGHDKKIEFILERRELIFYLIEDFGPVIDRVKAESNIPIIVVDAPWNRYLRSVQRVNGWDEILGILGERKSRTRYRPEQRHSARPSAK